MAFVNSLGQSLYPGLAESPNVLNGFLAWSPDCRYLAAFVEPGASTGTVWVLDTQGVEPARKLLDLPPGTRLRGAAWTGDATTIVMGQRQRNSDIVLFEP